MFTYCKQLQAVVTREECKKCPRFPGNEKEPGVYACHPSWSDDPVKVMWDGLIDIAKRSEREVL